MHQIVLITVLSATTGLCGGGKHHGKCHHRKAVAASCYSASPCGGPYATPYGSPYAAPTASMQSYPSSPQAVPAPMAVPTAPMVPAPPAPPAPAPSAAYPVPTSRPLGNLSAIGTGY